MAKFTILAFLLIAIFAVANATTITTITTTIVDENAKECRQEIKPMEDLRHCMMYISPQMNAQEEHLNQCCMQFKQIKKACRCMAIKEMVRQQQQQQQQGEMESQDMEKMVKDAMNIPSKCNIRMPQGQCDIKSSFYY